MLKKNANIGPQHPLLRIGFINIFFVSEFLIFVLALPTLPSYGARVLSNHAKIREGRAVCNGMDSAQASTCALAVAVEAQAHHDV